MRDHFISRRRFRGHLVHTVRAALVLCSIAFLVARGDLAPALAAVNSAPASDRFFGLTNLWTIHLHFTAKDWTALQQVPPRQAPNEADVNPPWISCSFECAGQTLTNVAIRLKGNSSLNAARVNGKLPLKVDFNHGAKGRSFLGVKEISLNSNVNDATQFREALAYDSCRLAGLPTPRTAFAKVYVTVTGRPGTQYLGLYTVVEPIDKDFLEARFATKHGLLLKPERISSLEYLGDRWSGYTNRYQPKTDVKPADAQRMVDLTRLIAQADDATLERELPQRLDLTNFLRYVAVMSILANFDSFIGNGHNYYLFLPSTRSQASFIPWDLNEAFGGHPGAGPRQGQADSSVLRFAQGQNRLLDRVLSNPKWSAAYRRELRSVLTNACDPDRLLAVAHQLTGVVQDAVFSESPMAKATFQRVALGQTDAAMPGPAPGDRRGGPKGPPEQSSFDDWITLRAKNVSDELEGKRSGKVMETRRGPPNGPPGR